ncbi:MAG: DUF1573 domain-containing protein [Planctomycetota bacterium]|nr:DUF1573 domain-containing protein [Planctomycetota bacterium]
MTIVASAPIATGQAPAPPAPPSASQSGSQQAVTRSPILVAPANLDLGYMTPRAIVTGNFTLANTTDQPITVRAAAPSCTCTTLDIRGKVIPAHGTLDVPVKMKVPAAPGRKTAQVNVVFEGLDIVSVLNMEGEVAFPIRLTSVDKGNQTNPFIDAHTDPTRTKGTIHAESLDRKPFTVTAVLGKPPVFVGFDPATETPRAAYDIAYDFSDATCELVPRFLTVETDRPDCRLLDMRVRHECTKIQAKIPWAEYRINAGAMVAGTTAPADIHIKRAGTSRAISVSSSDPEIAVGIANQVGDGDGVVVELTLAAAEAARPGLHVFPLTMKLANPQGQAIEDSILVYLLVDPK